MTMKLATTSAGFAALPRGMDSDSPCPSFGVASGEGVGVAAGFGWPRRPDCAGVASDEAHKASDKSASTATKRDATARDGAGGRCEKGGEPGSFDISFFPPPAFDAPCGPA